MQTLFLPKGLCVYTALNTPYLIKAYSYLNGFTKILANYLLRVIPSPYHLANNSSLIHFDDLKLAPLSGIEPLTNSLTDCRSSN